MNPTVVPSLDSVKTPIAPWTATRDHEPLNQVNARPRRTMVIALLILSAAVRLICFTGLIASDDVGYASYAQKLSGGDYQLHAHHYALRYGVIVPLAALYHLFGIHEWTTIILPLVLSSLSPLLIALLALRLNGHTAAWIAGLMLATFPVEIRYASILVPEPLLQTAILAGVLLFLLALEHRSAMFIALSGMVCGAAYLVKEPAIFVSLALMVYTILRKEWRLAILFSLGTGMVIISELTWYWAQSGDFLFRVHSMAAHNQTAEAMEANQNLPYRLLMQYPKWMLEPNIHFGLHSVLAVVLSGIALLRRRSHATQLLMLWAAMPLLYLNFGSSSLRGYWALPAAPRYLSVV
jgi:4-amino-4-deoxy-L-arabinose transferase-like glycosyltransferase